MPLVRPPDRPRRPPLRPDELIGRTALDGSCATVRSRSRAACRGARTPPSSSTSSAASRRAKAIYKPRPGRASAVGLPVGPRTGGRWRRGTCRRRSAGASCRRRSSATARSAKARCSCFVDVDFEQHYFTLYEDREDLHAVLRTHVRLRPPRQQHRSQERPLPPGPGRASVGHRPRALLLRRLQAAHGDLGIRGRTGARGAARRRWPGSARRCRPSIADLLDDDEVEALQDRAASLASRPQFPIDTTGRRYPWPMV